MGGGNALTLPETEALSTTAPPTRISHFEIVRRVGAGGMGVVYEARDTLLERSVALKVLHPSKVGGDVGPARLIREAQALARLSHPNVVGVHEVGSVGDEPFIAMEFVDGTTLAEWIRGKHDWREVLDVFIAAGRGLAAVHALGLVHRDFKPSNVLFDKQGVPKLGDFGLVAASEELTTAEFAAAPDPLATSTDGQTMTQPGRIMGTPAYAAPEQLSGLRVDARADVYAFAKSLREALGTPPSSTVPILARALAVDPKDRYEGMEPLLAALSRVRRGHRRTWVLMGAGVAVVGAVAAAWGLGRTHAAAVAMDPCPDPAPRVASVWNPTRRAALAAHLTAIDPSLGPARSEVMATIFERNGKRWVDMHAATCRRSLEKTVSGALSERVMSCLDLALVELEHTIGTVERTTDRQTIDAGMRAVVGMSQVDECVHGKELVEETPLPPGAAPQADIMAVRRESVAIDVALRSGESYVGLRERAQANADRARKLGHAPTAARAVGTLALVEFEDESVDALDTMREAINAASAGHADRIAADLWVKLLVTLRIMKRTSEAQTLVPAAEAAMARIDADPRLGAQFLQTKALLSMSAGDEAQARTLFDDAIKILLAAGADTATSPLASSLLQAKVQQVSVLALGNDWEPLVKELTSILSLAVGTWGADHPNLIDIHFNLGVGQRNLHDDTASLASFREAARIGEARLAPGARLASLLNAAGSMAVALGQTDAQAVTFLEHAVEMARKSLPGDDPRLAVQLSGLGAAYQAMGRFADARTVFEEQLRIYESRDLTTEKGYIDGVYSVGALLASEDRCTQALPHFERALAAYRKLGAAYDVTDTTIQIATCQHELKHYPQALRLSSAILAATDIEPHFLAHAHVVHGCALVASGKTAPGTAELKTARDELVKLEASKDILDELDRCLAPP